MRGAHVDARGSRSNAGSQLQHVSPFAQISSKKRAQKILIDNQYRRTFSLIRVLAAESRMTTPDLFISVSKRVIPRAVDRNRIRRLIREQVRKQDLPAMDLLVMVKRTAPTERRLSKQNENKLIDDLSTLIADLWRWNERRDRPDK